MFFLSGVSLVLISLIILSFSVVVILYLCVFSDWNIFSMTEEWKIRKMNKRQNIMRKYYIFQMQYQLLEMKIWKDEKSRNNYLNIMMIFYYCNIFYKHSDDKFYMYFKDIQMIVSFPNMSKYNKKWFIYQFNARPSEKISTWRNCWRKR